MTNDEPRPPGRKLKGPFVSTCPAGKYAWCRCERSSRYPFCDGTHRGTDVTPIKIVVDETRTIAWCGCGSSGRAPFCDGTHAQLP